MGADEVSSRLAERARVWRVAIDETRDTETSLVAFGRRADVPVVLKVIKRADDEWMSGDILEAFDGNGIVRVYEHVAGAVLLEHVRPGHALAELPLNGRDDEAIEILCDVVERMLPNRTVPTPTVQTWGAGFDRYVMTGDGQVPARMVMEAKRLFDALGASQSRPRLLHGDLQHYNVLFDRDRGWLAIDPKGVWGEIEYELGAALRNPIESPALFAKPAMIERRVARFASRLGLDAGRVLAWSFAQAVLSAIWDVEDGLTVGSTHPSLQLAAAVRPLLPNAGWNRFANDGED